MKRPLLRPRFAERGKLAEPARRLAPDRIRLADAAGPAAEAHEPPAGPHRPAPAPILPDDIRPRIRPDDFLPFFQVPGSASRPGDVILTVPAPASAGQPAPLPPSSATYTQTPK